MKFTMTCKPVFLMLESRLFFKKFRMSNAQWETKTKEAQTFKQDAFAEIKITRETKNYRGSRVM